MVVVCYSRNAVRFRFRFRFRFGFRFGFGLRRSGRMLFQKYVWAEVQVWGLGYTPFPLDLDLGFSSGLD